MFFGIRSPAKGLSAARLASVYDKLPGISEASRDRRGNRARRLYSQQNMLNNRALSC
jgi:hypothetical protein